MEIIVVSVLLVSAFVAGQQHPATEPPPVEPEPVVCAVMKDGVLYKNLQQPPHALCNDA